MAKYYGKIGFSETYEKSPGVTREKIIEKEYYGDILNIRLRNAPSTGINDNITVSQNLSIIGDPYGFANFRYIKYVTLHGCKWAVTDVVIEFPRLVLTIGGEYNVDEETT